MEKSTYIAEKYPDFELLVADGFDDAILGVDERSERVIYSIKKCIDTLIGEGMNTEDAIDYFYYNVEGAYVGEHTPIWCNDI